MKSPLGVYKQREKEMNNMTQGKRNLSNKGMSIQKKETQAEKGLKSPARWALFGQVNGLAYWISMMCGGSGKEDRPELCSKVGAGKARCMRMEGK